ncbi:outer membrane lipid asymmetry maintenance protein MlaD [Vibrio sp. MA40-2]|uniref:outer membrane lipid asymmetry maintenance protein MlaD n=1 Tax=Vibrio sp. MA40-2 TaxID=3391828 RepID=UPI0039A44EF9
MQQTRKLELWVGAFLFAGLIAVLIMVFKVANVTGLSSSNSYNLKAYFDNIGSLKVRSPVKIGGVVVGRVSSIDLDKDNFTPVVTMSIDEKYGKFPESSSAEILTSGLIGEQYIGLVPGFVFDDIEMLGNGDYIEDTKSAIVLEDLIGQVLYSVNDSDKE